MGSENCLVGTLNVMFSTASEFAGFLISSQEPCQGIVYSPLVLSGSSDRQRLPRRVKYVDQVDTTKFHIGLDGMLETSSKEFHQSHEPPYPEKIKARTMLNRISDTSNAKTQTPMETPRRTHHPELRVWLAWQPICPKHPFEPLPPQDDLPLHCLGPCCGPLAIRIKSSP